MEPIDKVQFKLTLPNIIAIVASTITMMTAFYAYKTESNNKLSALSSRIQAVENNQDINSLVIKNGFKSITNARQRDSADSVNGMRDIKDQLKELRGIMIHRQFVGSVAGN